MEFRVSKTGEIFVKTTLVEKRKCDTFKLSRSINTAPNKKKGKGNKYQSENSTVKVNNKGRKDRYMRPQYK